METLTTRLAAALGVSEGLLEAIADGEVQGFLATAEGDGLVMRTGGWPGRIKASPPVPPPAPAPFVLYRLLSAEGRTLYVGITRNLPARLRAHRRKWGNAWASATTEEYDDAEELMEAEAAAIRD